MFKSKIKSRLLQKYFLSYLIVFLIPFVVMSIFIYQQSVSSLKQEILKSNINKLDQVLSVSDSRMKELSDIASRMSYDSRLTRYMVEHPYSQIGAIEDLANYKVTSPIIEHIFLYYNKSNNIYSGEGLYALDTLNNLYHFYRPLENQFNQLEENGNVPVAIPSNSMNKEGAPGYITFLYPIPNNAPYKIGLVMYLVKESYYQSLLTHTLGDFSGNVFMFNKNRQLIAEKSNDSELSQAFLKKVAFSKKKITTAYYKKKKYSIVTVQSPTTGWTFATVLPTSQFYNRVIHIRLFLFALFLSIIFAGLLLAIVFTIRNTRPISRLMEYAQTNKREEHRIKNTYSSPSSLNNMIEGFISSHDQLERRVTAQQPFVRDQCLIRLLRGDWEDIQEILRACNLAGINFKYEYYYVVYGKIEVSQVKKAKSKDIILKNVQTISFVNTVHYIVELVSDNGFVIVLNSKTNNVSEQENQVNMIHQQVNRFQENITLGVGTHYLSPDHINNSFIEALGAAEYRLSSGSNSIIFFKNLVERSETNDWYPEDIKIKLIQGLKQGNRKVAIESLRDLFQFLNGKNISINLLKCYCFDIINVVQRTATELNYNDLNKITNIVEFTSVNDLESRLMKYVLSICEVVEKSTIDQNKVLHQKIIKYIDQHFKDYTFSLETMAAHFGLSESYLSRFIKEQTGVTYTKYLWGLRMREVKRLLKETDQPIRSIVQSVGYVDVPNFTRKFKKTEGITPGEFRKKNNVP